MIANVILPTSKSPPGLIQDSGLITTHTDTCDINVSPDKRTIFLHGENHLVQALKVRPCINQALYRPISHSLPQTALETAFSAARSTYDVTTQPSQNLQQSKSQGRQLMRTSGRDRERGEKRPQEPEESARTSHPLRADDTNGTHGEDEPIMMGVPHLLLGDGASVNGGSALESEPEPEPTLVAQPWPSGKGGRRDAQDGIGQGSSGIIDRPRSRAPSEPLFFPESDEENDTSRVDKGKKKEGTGSRQSGDKRACSPQTIRSASTSTTTLTHIARSSTNIPDKPRSVQTVLSTRGAAWNLRKDRDANAEDGRERKRARLSSEGDRVPTKKSFRSSLSQFLGTGRKALPDEEAEESGSDGKNDEDRDQGRGARKGGDSSEVDELDEEDMGEKRPGRGRKKRLRAGSDSSQVTMIVPSDDEHAMDVDGSPSTIIKPSHPTGPSTPQTSAGNVAGGTEDLSGDDWAFSSTLVGTYVPPAGKTVEPSSSSSYTRPLAETDTDFVTLRVNLVSIGSYYLDMHNHFSSSSESPSTPPLPTPNSTLRSAVSSANLETAAEDTVAAAALSRVISKTDFERMVVAGQFNLGFIIVRKRSGAMQGGGGGTMDDLFIVDQHAADEKWNFETLQEKTVIASQKLFRCVFPIR